MAKRLKNVVPKKFRDKEFSFVNTLEGIDNGSHTLMPFPASFKFAKKEKDEDIILIVRKHWIRHAPDVVFALLLLLIPIILIAVNSGLKMGIGSIPFFIGVSLASLVISMNILVTAIVQWHYTISIITNKRIISQRVSGIFTHSVTEILWRRVQDVGHDSIGFLSTVFDIGNIYIDTAGDGVDLTLRYIPKPRDVQSVINNLVDMSHQGKL